MIDTGEDNFTFRGMRRAAKSLPEETCLEILERGQRGVLSVLGDGGYPYGLPINYVFKDGKIYFHGALVGHKMDAISRCDKASFCVIDTPVKKNGNWWYTTQSVICFGRIRKVEDKSVSHEALLSLARKFFPSEDIVQKEMLSEAGAAILCFEIEHMTGKWVHEK